jgi:transcriptional regulator with XRE-family HTH domain/SOS-response transcriptional repressor LexA
LKHFGELLKEYRASRNLTQQEIADRLGLSSPYIAQIESGFKPPPPQLLVEKLSLILQLNYEDRREFAESAEKERELQSLVKATRKVGHILAGNKVCTPQKSVSFRIRQEIDDIINTVPRDITFSIDLLDWGTKQPNSARVIRNHEEMKSWAITRLGDKPTAWLAFLGLLYEVLILTPDERLLCRHPTSVRINLVNSGPHVGTFFQLLEDTIKSAIHQAEEQKLPNVIAPHEAWKNIDEVLGSKPANEVIIPNKGSSDHSIQNVPVVGIIQQGTDEFEETRNLGTIGLPSEWFTSDMEYEACHVLTDSYVSLGVWPGCRAVYELFGQVQNEDLVVVQLGDRRCIRKYYDLGEEILLQGGPLSRPIRVMKNEPSIRIIGVIRDLISRFHEMRKGLE